MDCRRIVTCVSLLGVLGCAVNLASAAEKTDRWTSEKLPLKEMPAELRDKIKTCVDDASLAATGPAEEFPCKAAQYHWLLDHPDRAIQMWRKLGAKCLDINDEGGGKFGCKDTSGNEVHWQTVYKGKQMRVWFAEGDFKLGVVPGTVHVQAVVVLRHIETEDPFGRPAVRHQADFMMHTDSKTMAVVTKLVGKSAPHLAEQYLAQLERFFSALACLLDQQPEKAKALLTEAPAKKPSAELVNPSIFSVTGEPEKVIQGTSRP